MKTTQSDIQDQSALKIPPSYSEEIILADPVEPNFRTAPAPYWASCLSWVFDKTWGSALTLIVLDSLAAFFGLLLGIYFDSYFYPPINHNKYFSSWVLFIIVLIIILYLKQGYNRMMERRSYQELRSIVLSSSWAIFLMFACNFIIAHGIIFSRIIFLSSYFFTLFLLIIFRFGVRELIKKFWNYNLCRENVIVIGDSTKHMKWILDHLHIQRYKGFNILGYLAQQPSSTVTGLKYLGNYEKLSEISQKIRVNKVFFAMRGYSDHRHNELLERLEQCAKLKIPAMVISRIFNTFYFSLILDNFSGIFVVDRRQPAYNRPIYRLLKRSLDILGSLFILSISLPIWLLAILCIKFHDGGPILFRHKLLGKDGKIYYALKFRTMLVNAEEILKENQELFQKFLKNYKLKDDPRITPCGKWLRKYSLDELPQFINILKGEMSLVGPRPVKEEELDRFGDFKEERLKVRPGLTGFWQVSGRSNTKYEERAQMDKFYMYKCDIWMDLIILLKTPLKVLTGDGAV
jgi:exopolysaccharide biosynthesis polyprenyl glycosylphosphotransferase